MSATQTPLHRETIAYEANGKTLQGYLAYAAEQAGKRPGVLVIHEWWGLNDYIRRRADKLAELGYCALAADMYGGGQVADNPGQAGNLMNAVLNDMETGTARLRAAYQCLTAQPQVDANKIAAIGYCFGGAMALHGARIGMDLDAVVSFHGALGSFHQPAEGEVKAKVLVCHGAADSLISAADIANFKAEMERAKADYEFIAYDDALHGFTNPEATANGNQYNLPLAYDERADRQSWQAMQALFNEVFK